MSEYGDLVGVAICVNGPADDELLFTMKPVTPLLVFVQFTLISDSETEVAMIDPGADSEELPAAAS